MQRINTAEQSVERRAAGAFIGLVLVVMTAVCGLFWAVGQPIPGWFHLVGRWVPALVSLVVLRLVRLPGGVIHWWWLRPGGWRLLVRGFLVAVAAVVAVYAISVAIAVSVTELTPEPPAFLAQVAVLVVPMALVLSVSTLGEQVAWRGFLQRLLADRGFWGASLVVAAVWTAFHIPLHGVMAIDGSMPAAMAVTSTVAIFPFSLVLSAVAVRFQSVWPAVFGHAVPMSALNLVVDPDAAGAGDLWVLTVITAVVMTVAAVLLAPSRAEPVRRADR